MIDHQIYHITKRNYNSLSLSEQHGMGIKERMLYARQGLLKVYLRIIIPFHFVTSAVTHSVQVCVQWRLQAPVTGAAQALLLLTGMELAPVASERGGRCFARAPNSASASFRRARCPSLRHAM